MYMYLPRLLLKPHIEWDVSCHIGFVLVATPVYKAMHVPVAAKMHHCSLCVTSGLVPRLSSSFFIAYSVKIIVQVIKSWMMAWEWGYTTSHTLSTGTTVEPLLKDTHEICSLLEGHFARPKFVFSLPLRRGHLCLQDTLPGPQGVRNRGARIYTGHFTRSPRCPQ